MLDDDFRLLSEELLETILAFVPTTNLLQSTCYVSTRFAYVIRKESFWHDQLLQFQLQLLTSKSSSTNTSSSSSVVAAAVVRVNQTPTLTKHQIQRCCLYQQFIVKDGKTNDEIPAYLQYGPVLASRTMAMQARQRHQQEHERPVLTENDIAELVAAIQQGRNNGVIAGGCCCVVASTTDQAHEQLENVLVDDEQQRVHHEDEDGPYFRSLPPLQRWWSSSPSPSPDNSHDTLLFASRYPLMVLSKLRIKPLRDPLFLLEQNPIFYPSKRIIIKAYRISMNKFVANNNINNDDEDVAVDTNNNSNDIRNKGFPLLIPIVVPNEGAGGRDAAAAGGMAGVRGDFDEDDDDRRPPIVSVIPGQETIDQLLEGQNPVYESDELVVPPDHDDMIEFDLTTTQNNNTASPVIANVVTFELLGKHHEQRPGTGYFCCVERVESEGIPLLLFQDDMMEQAATTTTTTH